MIVDLTPEVIRTLTSARVGVAGAGGLGSNCALALARAGVGALTLLDMDEVEASNLNRQAYTVDQVGLRKVDALAHNVAAAAPSCAVRTVHLRFQQGMASELFGDCQVVVEAFDAAEAKVALLEDVLGSLPEVWLVAGSGIAGIGGNQLLRTQQLGRLFVVGDGQTAAAPGVALLAPRVVAVAAMQANQALACLLGDVE